MYSASDLREKISIEKTVSKQDAQGYYKEGWEKVCDTYAKVLDISGKEYMEAAARQALNVVSFTIRWREDIDTGMRIMHKGKAYEIEYIGCLGYKRDFMTIKARLRDGEGRI